MISPSSAGPDTAPQCLHSFDDLALDQAENGAPYIVCTKCGTPFTRLAQQVVLLFAKMKELHPKKTIITPGVMP